MSANLLLRRCVNKLQRAFIPWKQHVAVKSKNDALKYFTGHQYGIKQYGHASLYSYFIFVIRAGASCQSEVSHLIVTMKGSSWLNRPGTQEIIFDMWLAPAQGRLVTKLLSEICFSFLLQPFQSALYAIDLAQLIVGQRGTIWPKMFFDVFQWWCPHHVSQNCILKLRS